MFLVVLTCCCDIPDGNEICGVPNETMAPQWCIQLLVILEDLVSIEGAVRCYKEGTLRSRRKHGNIIGKISPI